MGSPDNEGMRGLHILQSFIHRGKEGLPGIRLRAGMIENEVRAVGQGLAAEAFKGFEAHDHRLPESRGLEMLEIFREMPGKLIPFPDHAIVRNSNDME